MRKFCFSQRKIFQLSANGGAEKQNINKITYDRRERYIFVNLVLLLQDLHLVDLEDFKYAGTNLTAFRLVDPDNADVRVSH